MTLFGNPTVQNFLWLIAAGFGVGLGWHIASWLVGRTIGRI